MNVNSSDKDYIKDCFPLSCECIETTGLDSGIILKFKTFYLKIYDAGTDSYTVNGYRYNDPRRVFVHEVPRNRIRSYASNFRTEDGLLAFDKT